MGSGSSLLVRYLTLVGTALIAVGCTVTSVPRYGTLGDSNVYHRTILIRPQTSSVNVVEDEVVRFVVERTGKSFVWQFNTGDWITFDIDKIAPPDVIDQPVKVYVNSRVRFFDTSN